jgi:hypothetical protein
MPPRPSEVRGWGKPLARRVHNCRFSRVTTVQIIALARSGLPRKYAAQAVGVGERTLQRWVGNGRENLAALDEADEAGLPAKPDRWGRFLLDLLQAEAAARGEELSVIREAAADGDWHAAAWILERVDNAQFGRPLKFEAVAHDENGQEIPAADMLLDRLREMSDRLASAAAGEPGPDEATSGG